MTPVLAGIAAALLAAACVGPGPRGPGARRIGACTTSHWVGSWADSPSDAGTGLDASLHSVRFGTGETVRMILTPHLAGTIARLHLSNRFGAQPLRFGAVSIADRQAGAVLVAGSARPVTFHGGSASVTVPAGGEVLSDPVSFTVVPFTDVAVSLYVPGSDLRPTEHFTARQTSFLTLPGAGDHTSDAGAGAFLQHTTARDYVTGLDVDAPAATGAVVAFGDSLTDGFQGPRSHYPEVQSTLDENARWPDDLQRRLDAAQVPLSVLNAGISGNRLLAGPALPPLGPAGVDRFAADALAQSGVSDVIALAGINDISLGSGAVTAQDVIAGDERLIDAAHAAGVAIQLGTLTPTGTSTQPGGAQLEATRVAVNRWIRGQHASDGIVDFDAAVRDPADPARVVPVDDGGDGLHMSPAGYQAMGAAVDLAGLSRPRCLP